MSTGQAENKEGAGRGGAPCRTRSRRTHHRPCSSRPLRPGRLWPCAAERDRGVGFSAESRDELQNGAEDAPRRRLRSTGRVWGTHRLPAGLDPVPSMRLTRCEPCRSLTLLVTFPRRPVRAGGTKPAPGACVRMVPVPASKPGRKHLSRGERRPRARSERRRLLF